MSLHALSYTDELTVYQSLLFMQLLYGWPWMLHV